MKFLAWVVVAAVVAGCGGGGHGRSIDDAGNSLVFGYVDMADAPTKVSGVQIRQVAPPTDKPFWGTDVRDGMFYTAYLPQGSYMLASLYGSSFWRGEHQYNFPRQGGETAIARSSNLAQIGDPVRGVRWPLGPRHQGVAVRQYKQIVGMALVLVTKPKRKAAHAKPGRETH